MPQRPANWSTAPAPAALAVAWAALALCACGGGGGGSGAGTAAPVAGLSPDQSIYESAELHGGSFALLWNLPYGGGAIVTGVDYFSASTTGGIAQSPATAGTQRETPDTVSLAAALTVPYQLPLRYLQGGQVYVRSADAPRLVSYVGSEVQVQYVADDGQTVVETARFHDFTQAPLAGAMSASGVELQAAYPIAQWIEANHFDPSASWLAGAAYNKRHGGVVGDTYFAEDCANQPGAGTTLTNDPTPCLTGATLDTAFPITQLDANGHPFETDFAGDGQIVAVQGLRMWVASAPLPGTLEAVPAYRTYFERNGNVYMGSIWKDGTAFRYRQTDGSVVDYLVGLNQAATDSVQGGLVTVTVMPGSALGTAAVAASDDLFGIGGHGVNGALAPSDLAAAYDLPATADGSGQTIAIVDAPGSGDASADLDVYSQAFGLPTCDAGNGCFLRLDLSYGAPVAAQSDWGAEVAMDTQMVHAIAPRAHILLVTAASASTADLLAAVNAAAAQAGVTAISMSFSLYGDPASTYQAQDAQLATLQAQQGLVFFAASGDTGNSGLGAGYPAESPWVTAVGGTRLLSAGAATPGTETGWQFSSGGISSYAAMPAWQGAYLGTAAATANGHMRATPDVAAVADYEHSAVAVYYKQHWIMGGGTSVAAPIWAGIAALLAQDLGNRGSSLAARVMATPGGFNALLYRSTLTQGMTPALRDVTGGNNNLTLSPCPLCSAGPGYDDVSGLGAPDVARLMAGF